MKFLFYFEIFLIFLIFLGYEIKKEEPEKKEKIDIEKLFPKIKWYQFVLLPLTIPLLFVVIYGPIIFLANLHSETEKPKWENDGLFLSKDFVITLIILILWTHFFYVILFYEASKDLKLWSKQKEEETKQNIQKSTEKLKQELLEIKTELLLTQNKLRELKDKE
jgi:hypothetical protein